LNARSEFFHRFAHVEAQRREHFIVRDRPACSRPPVAPIFSVSRFSSAVWPSFVLELHPPLAARVGLADGRERIADRLEVGRVRSPQTFSISAWAIDAATSCFTSRIVELVIVAGGERGRAPIERLALVQRRVIGCLAAPRPDRALRSATISVPGW